MNMNLIQRLAIDWGIRCFGIKHVTDTRVRGLRCAEEAIELAQVCEVPAEQLHKLIDYVYARPKGIMQQELGGVALTLMVCCGNSGNNIEDVAFNELRRILDKDPEAFAKRNVDKIKEGFTG